MTRRTTMILAASAALGLAAAPVIAASGAPAITPGAARAAAGTATNTTTNTTTTTTTTTSSTGTATVGPALATLVPNRTRANSRLTVTQRNISGYGLPTALTLVMPRGFATSPRSVAALCSAADASGGTCPAASRVGSGVAHITATYAALQVKDTLNITLSLGRPARKGDIATIVFAAKDTSYNQSGEATGRLLRTAQGALELRFDKLPQSQLPPGTTVDLNDLTLRAGAIRTVITGKGRRRRRTTYSLITNPRTCPSGGWASTLRIEFGAQSSVSSRPTAACRK